MVKEVAGKCLSNTPGLLAAPLPLHVHCEQPFTHNPRQLGAPCCYADRPSAHFLTELSECGQQVLLVAETNLRLDELQEGGEILRPELDLALFAVFVLLEPRDLGVSGPQIAIGVHVDLIRTQSYQRGRAEGIVGHKDREAVHTLPDEGRDPPRNSCIAAVADKQEVEIGRGLRQALQLRSQLWNHVTGD